MWFSLFTTRNGDLGGVFAYVTDWLQLSSRVSMTNHLPALGLVKDDALDLSVFAGLHFDRLLTESMGCNLTDTLDLQ